MKKANRLILVVVAILMFSSFPVLMVEEEREANADVGTPDAFGYIWIDSKDPAPKVPYEWIDVRGNPSSQRVFNSYYYRYVHVSFPFSFPFYDTTLNGLYVYGCGLMTSRSGDRYYNYYSGDLNSLTSDYAIAPYWIYNGYTTISVYTLQGQDEDGTKWFALEWYYPGYGGTSNFEVVLYESGLIKMEYKTPRYYSYYQGGIVGIKGKMGSQTIVNHYTVRNSPRRVEDNSAVWFTSGKSIVWELDLLNGDGVNGNILYPYKGEYYVIRTVMSSERGPTDLAEAVITLGPGKEGVEFRYNFDTGEFRKENDPAGYTILNRSLSRATLDPATGNYTILFYFKVTFSYPRESFDDYVSVKATAVGKLTAPGNLQKDDLFGVEKRVELVGELRAIGEYNGYIPPGTWGRGGEKVWFVGLKGVYYGSSVQLPPEIYTVEIYDQFMKVWEDEWIEIGEEMNVTVELPEETTYRVYNVRIGGMVPEEYDVTSIGEYRIRVDGDAPGVPYNFEMHPDDIMDPASTMDDDGDVYFTWDPAVDTSSGVKGYYVSLGPRGSGAERYFVEEPLTEVEVRDLGEGEQSVYIWSVDKAGNEGNEIFLRIVIDKSPVEFSGFYPQERVWLNTNRPLISIYINDSLSGVNPRTIQYRVSTNGIGGYGGWQTVFGYEVDKSVRVVVQPTLKNGQENYIQFRAKDVVGNGYVESPDYNLWVDTEPVRFTSFTPREGEWQPTTLLTVSVKIDDRSGSGVDPGSIEYRVSTRGVRHYTPWMRYTEAVGGRSVVVSFEYEFARGSENYVQFRARDVAGNPLVVSKDYQILVKTQPVLVIESPPMGDVYLDNETVVFDARGSYDEDGDEFEVVWSSSIDGELGRGEYIERRLSAGDHLITVSAVVNEQVVVSREIRVKVLEHEEEVDLSLDTDGDYMPDWWERRYGLDPEDSGDANVDSDGDGFSNLQEYLKGGYNPKNPWSHPPVEAPPPERVEEELISVWLLLMILLIVVATLLYTGYMSRRVRHAERRVERVIREKRLMRSVRDEDLGAIYTIGVQLASGALGVGLPAGGAGGEALPGGVEEGVAGYLPSKVGGEGPGEEERAGGEGAEAEGAVGVAEAEEVPVGGEGETGGGEGVEGGAEAGGAEEGGVEAGAGEEKAE